MNRDEMDDIKTRLLSLGAESIEVNSRGLKAEFSTKGYSFKFTFAVGESDLRIGTCCESESGTLLTLDSSQLLELADILRVVENGGKRKLPEPNPDEFDYITHVGGIVLL